MKHSNHGFRPYLIIISAILLAFSSTSVSYQVPDEIDEKIKAKVRSMTMKELYGQKLIIGVPWLYPNEQDQEILKSQQILHELIFDLKISNFVLSDINFRDWMSFTNNLDDYRQQMVAASNVKRQIQKTRLLLKSAQTNIPPIFAADFEGGLVQHFRGEGFVSQTPSPMNFTATGNLDNIKKFGKLTSELFMTLGLTTNFAPLVDVNSETSLSVIGTRSFSSEPLTVIRMATSFAEGMSEVGIAPVIKHWPGLGNTPDTSGRDTNIDIHEYSSPLTFNGSLRQYFHIYEKLLKREQFKATGIMTAHVAVDSYRNICQKDYNLVGFCRKIIDDGIRNKKIGLGATDHVVISDDVAYLKATRKQFENIDSAINQIFKSGHDMIIIGSLTPNYTVNNQPCGEETHILDCRFDRDSPIPFLVGLKDFYKRIANKHPTESLKRSVERILKWKYLTYSSLMGEEKAKAHWLEPSFAYKPKTTEPLNAINQKFRNLSEQVYKNSVVVIHPAGSTTGTLSSDLSLRSSKIYCIGPTFNENDLRTSLTNEIGLSNVDCKDLSYHPSEINSEDFVENNSSHIVSEIRRTNSDLVIFGLVNKLKHIKVFVNVFNSLQQEQLDGVAGKQRKVILIAFNSPGVIEEIHKRIAITQDLYVLTTFSNSSAANQKVVSALMGDIELKPIENLPIALRGYHGWVNVLGDADINEVEKTLTENPPAALDRKDNRIKIVSALIGSVVAFILMYKISHLSLWYAITCPLLGAFIFLTIGKQQIDSINVPKFNVVEGFTIDLKFFWPWLGAIITSVLAFFILSGFSKLLRTINKINQKPIETEDKQPEPGS